MTRKRAKKIGMSFGLQRNVVEKVLSRKPKNTPNKLTLGCMATVRLADLILQAERITGETLGQLVVEADYADEDRERVFVGKCYGANRGLDPFSVANIDLSAD